MKLLQFTRSLFTLPEETNAHTLLRIVLGVFKLNLNAGVSCVYMLNFISHRRGFLTGEKLGVHCHHKIDNIIRNKKKDL